MTFYSLDTASMASLAEQLVKLTTPAPIFDDPEDIEDDTVAKLAERHTQYEEDIDEDDLSDPSAGSKLRRQTAGLLADSDAKYAGKRVSRRSLDDLIFDTTHAADDEEDDAETGDVDEVDSDDDESDDGDDDDNSDDEINDDDEKDDDDIEDDELAAFKQKIGDEPKSSAKSQEFVYDEDIDFQKFAEESDMSSEGDSESSEGEEEEEEEEEEGGVESFSKSNMDEEKKKGEATKSQLSLWDSLLKGRIELQKLVTIVNQLPQPQACDQFTQQGGDEYQSLLKEGQQSLKKVLDELVSLQTSLLVQNPDTRFMVDASKSAAKKAPTSGGNNDNEEITSESDAETGVKQEVAAKKKSPAKKRRIKMTDYPDFLAKRHKTFKPYRDATIQKWYDKTRVATGKLSKGFSAFEQSALKQIDQILGDRDRLIKRTQLKRSVYKVLGKEEVTKSEEDGGDNENKQIPERDYLKDYDAEIFDDDDFYHQLLRELIERKTSDISDPVAISRQWLEIQKLRTKVKKRVDTKASKGRKIRYDVHPKLVNFMAPVEQSSWSDQAKNDLYSSVFGKRTEVTAASPVQS